MPGKPFTNYLLKLATDASEVARFRNAGNGARQSMDAAGLTDVDLQNILLDGDQAAIEKAVSAELVISAVPPGTTAIHVQIVSLVQVQTKPPPGE